MLLYSPGFSGTFFEYINEIAVISAMKRILLIMILGWCVQSYAGENSIRRDSIKRERSRPSGDGASAKGNVVIQPALNFGHHLGFGKLDYAGNAYGSGLVPGVTLNLDANVHDYISVGVYYGAAFRNYSTTNVSYFANAFGVRTAFHWWQLLDDKSDADLFSSHVDFDVHAHFGAYLATFKDKTLGIKSKAKGFSAGGGIAMRYYFVEHFGVALEFGYEEASWAKLGFAIKI
jgi:hypothetical protein